MCTVDTVLSGNMSTWPFVTPPEPFVEPARGEGQRIAWRHRDGRTWVVQLVRRFWTEFSILDIGKGGLLWLNILR